MKIIAVVITYNRLDLLKKNIEALRQQTYLPDKIIVINNHSTDGTTTYLKSCLDIETINMDKNEGGAGGFTEGISIAAKEKADWIWVMDDDTIPRSDALEKMIPYTANENIGFINSWVIWKDGTQHLMNKPRRLKNQEEKLFPQKLNNNCHLIKQASFVSLLIKGSIPWSLGLPYKEFFIWCDDAEYTLRITKGGYYGIQIDNSIVLHATPTNYVASLTNINSQQAWKLYYGERNASFLRRKEKGRILFWLSQINEFRLHRHKIKKRHLPHTEEKIIMKASMKGLWDGLFFNPHCHFLV